MTCPICEEPTIVTPAGDHLNPTPGRLGRVGRDGIEFTPDEIRHPSIRGYYPHFCPTITTAPKQSNQDSLF